MSVVPISEVRVGDRISKDGIELTVSRIEGFIFPGYVSFIEDSDVRWLKLPLKDDAEVEVL